MHYRDELDSIRRQIDEVDGVLVSEFQRRMKLGLRAGEIKANANLSLTDQGREKRVVDNALSKVEDEFKSETSAFMRNLIALSKIKQRDALMIGGKSHDDIHFPPSAAPKTHDVTAAYQGVRGAWGETAAMSLFPDARHANYEYFEDVFVAVKNAQADYGILPIENSQTGAIGEVYDLLRRYACYIVGQTWIPVAQCLIAKKGAKFTDIREVLSHPQGFSQARRFLKDKNWILTACRNTAVAAQAVSEKSGADAGLHVAAIGSRRAAAIFDLQVLAPDIMDDANNKTRFIAIASKPIYNQACDCVSVTFSTLNVSGALCAVMQSFMLAGINLTRIESRPVSADKYRFFADLQANVMSGETRDALKVAAAHCEYFEILGCHKSDGVL